MVLKKNPSLIVVEKFTQAEKRFYCSFIKICDKKYHPKIHDQKLPDVETSRKFRFDFVWPEQRICVEVQGGLHIAKSEHRTARGVMRDIDKVNFAQFHGFNIYQVPGHISQTAMKNYSILILKKVIEKTKNI